MTQGRSIRLFLVDGAPNGLLTAEIMNWTGHVLTGPRSKLPEIIERPECVRTGIYFLVGPDPGNSMRPLVYIGESDDVAARLKQHNREEGKGGKDFWEKVCLVTSKDQNLTKAHVKYLESRLMAQAKHAGRCGLVNGTAHEYGVLPEADQSDMAFFAEQIRIVLPVLGFDFLKAPAETGSTQQTPASPESPVFEMAIPKYGINARAREIDGEFVVLEGSLARDSWVSEHKGYSDLFQQLVQDGVLVSNETDKRRFTKDHSFSSPSAAAAVVSGRNANGRTSWFVEGTRKSYSDWQDEIISQQSHDPDLGEA
ncbi:GIY-YIG nuclease family protein [Aquisalimonas sp. APHAB1-3]|uniref:GIY-YIG nuclease family protein n=1 Tax=Aquisalimonas sp. APHAB1-3 TaxID=3402080 RepID=UPI003AAD747A